MRTIFSCRRICFAKYFDFYHHCMHACVLYSFTWPVLDPFWKIFGHIHLFNTFFPSSMRCFLQKCENNTFIIYRPLAYTLLKMIYCAINCSYTWYIIFWSIFYFYDIIWNLPAYFIQILYFTANFPSLLLLCYFRRTLMFEKLSSEGASLW